MTKTYTELRKLRTFEERYAYLRLGGAVGVQTFGFDRYINQAFYGSREWSQVRDLVIVRDEGCDLGIPGREIHDSLLVHHINPMSSDDIVHDAEWILDPNFLITTTKRTHNAIHYGDQSLLLVEFAERRPGDTKLW